MPGSTTASFLRSVLAASERAVALTQTGGLLFSQVTLWGNPGDPRHNDSRGWECVAGGAFSRQVGKPCPASSTEPNLPFVRTPTSCAPDPANEHVSSSVAADSWAEPGNYASGEYAWTGLSGEALGFTGCEALLFNPALDGRRNQKASPRSTPPPCPRR